MYSTIDVVQYAARVKWSKWCWSYLCVHVTLCRRLRANFIEHITSSYLTKIARYLLGDGISSIEDRRSATLNRVTLTSLKLADGSACWRYAMLFVWIVGSGEGLPSPLEWEFSRPPFERGWVRSIKPTISIGRWPAGKSQRSNAETWKYNAQSRMSEAKRKGQMLNAGWEKTNVHSTELEGRIP